jgi:hypothetical protein
MDWFIRPTSGSGLAALTTILRESPTAKHDRDPVLREPIRSVDEAGHYLHLRAARLASGDGPEGLWRIQADEIDAWPSAPTTARPARTTKALRPAPRLLGSQ